MTIKILFIMPGMLPFSHARVETNLSFTLLDPRPSENPIKSLLSFRPSLCLSGCPSVRHSSQKWIISFF